MPWQLPQEVAERVERARRLLADSEAHRGSADLQHFAESAALTEQLHRAWLLEDGTVRQRMTTAQKQQGLVLFLLWSLNHLQGMPHVSEPEDSCIEALHKTANAFMASRPSRSAHLSSHFSWMLGWWPMNAVFASSHWDATLHARAQRELRQGWMSSWEKEAQRSSLLQLVQQQQGFQPAISTGQLHQLFLLVRSEVRERLARQETLGGAAWRALMAEQAADCAQLCQLQPGSPAYLEQHAFNLYRVKRFEEATDACLTALRAAKAANASLVFSKAASLAGFMITGDGSKPVPVARLASVRNLVAAAFQRLALLQEWGEPSLAHQVQHWLGGHREECTRIVTQRFDERVAAVARARAGGGGAGELAERVERARRLLEGSREYQGSTDLQHFIECADLTTELHRLFLNDDGQPHRGLTGVKKHEGLVMLLRWTALQLEALDMPWILSSECLGAMSSAAHQLLKQCDMNPAAHGHAAPGLALLAQLSTASLLLVLEGGSEQERLRGCRRLLAGLLQRDSVQQDMEAGLAAYQLQQGFAGQYCSSHCHLPHRNVPGARTESSLCAAQDASPVCQLALKRSQQRRSLSSRSSKSKSRSSRSSPQPPKAAPIAGRPPPPPHAAAAAAPPPTAAAAASCNISRHS
ncbi:13e12 repeat-containing [Chlorella sorokiniana]|uniref:13e12 repeat-containing n=1 Tax=Chlorella sorokiniana TaxID=3076 RepID=A0A2P6U341_CHLSO|nr:13e12 repeat-containing [Chlorella sorokiniana]|eukprot:PRW60732.1 13e12 repeat-containing [Chlorella sorokiniana]